VSLPVVVQDDAEIEVEEAALWYEDERPGLGLEYIAAVSRVMVDIGEDPERFPLWKPPWRRALLRRFPYVVFFEIEKDRAVVWAVAHARRRPGYWAARRPPSGAS
jgi:plasmid stabilization system protein ParE